MYRFDILRNPVPRSLFSGSHPVHSFVAFPHGLCHIRIFLHAYVYQADLIVFPVKTAQAALIAIVKNLLKLLLNGTSTYYVGELGNIIGSCMFSVPAALIYRRHKTKKTAMVALAAGVICAIVCAITLPFYAKVAFGGIENIIAMGTKINPAVTNLYTFAIFMIVPFNLVKCGLNAIVTALVYKHVSVIIHAGVHREKKTENTAA